MNDDFNLAVHNLKQSLYEEPLIQEYFKVKNQVENDIGIAETLKNMRLAQKEMSQNMDNDDIYFPAKRAYEGYLKSYSDHPLVQNLQILQEEVHNLLTQIKTILE